MPPHPAGRKPAQNEANQAGLDRLWAKYDKDSQNPNSKIIFSLRKAIKSLQACPEAIVTHSDAKKLHGVGDSLARMIVGAPTLQRSASVASSNSAASATSNTAANKNKSSSTEARHADVSQDSSAGATKRRRKDPPLPPTAPDPLRLSEKQKAYQQAVKSSLSLHLPALKNWKVLLLVDRREHHSKQIMAKLQMCGVPCQERQLPIGDMAWIAYSGSVEILLGTIIERKEVNDLASSLFGTRYKEQRLRLANCGLPQVILLVEGDTRSVQNCPHDTLQMCMMETRVQLGFQVIQTKHIEDSVRLLKALHRRILQRAFPTSFGGDSYETSLPTFSSPSSRRRRKSLQKSRRSLEDFVFDEAPQSQQQDRLITYQELKCKIEKDREEGTRTVEAIYCGMLKQISKISDSTVSAIAQAYPTPNALLKALNGLDQAQGTALLADIGAGDKRVGEAKAREIYKVFGVETMDLADQSASSAQNEENITEATLPSVADSVPLRDHPQPSSFRQTPPRTNNLLRYDAIELDDSSSDDSDGKDDKPHAIATVTQKQAPIIDSSSENEETSPTSTTSPLPLAERIRHLRVQLKSTAEATRSAAAGGTASQRVVLRPSSREVIELLD